MKALKSPMAKKVLADPKAKEQLRRYLATKSAQGSIALSSLYIEVRSQEGRVVRIKPVVVPKAA